jgi:hypothetical protein
MLPGGRRIRRRVSRLLPLKYLGHSGVITTAHGYSMTVDHLDYELAGMFGANFLYILEVDD